MACRLGRLDVPSPKPNGRGTEQQQQQQERWSPPREEDDVLTGLLYEVKGARYPTTLQVDASVRSLHAGSTFILDAGRTIFLYHGQQSPRRCANALSLSLIHTHTHTHINDQTSLL
jgi:hypothetical protein